MKVLSIRKDKSGGANVKLELTNKEEDQLVFIGLEQFVIEENIKAKVLLVTKDELEVISPLKCKKYELNKEEKDLLIQMAFNYIIKEALKEEWLSTLLLKEEIIHGVNCDCTDSCLEYSCKCGEEWSSNELEKRCYNCGRFIKPS